MGLSMKSVAIACDIFLEIKPGRELKFHQPQFVTEENKLSEDFIIGADPSVSWDKEMHGWECVWINVKDITPAQKDIWKHRVKEVPNSSFSKLIKPGITQLGWF